MNDRLFLSSAFLLSACFTLGCGTANPTGEDAAAPGETAAATDTHDHDHDHEHEHHHEPLGPNKGHLIQLQPAEYMAEWLHDDKSNLVTIFILDATGEKEMPIPAEEVTVETVIDESTIAYQLPAGESSDEDPPRAARFEKVSAPLLTGLTVGTGVDAHLKFTVDGTEFRGEIEHHEHEHGHHH